MLSSNQLFPGSFNRFLDTRILLITKLFILVIILLPYNLAAQGNLLVTPKRVVFEGTKRSFDLNLANIGQDTAVYAISLVQVRMKEDGSFETITIPDEGQNFADKNLRFFPRSVTLPPNDAQVVKVQLLRTNQLSPGEYRSHFYFRSVPEIKPLGEEEVVADTSAISVRLTPVFGITIPAIIRIGESTTKIILSDLALSMVNDTIPNFSLVFNRTGNMSAYGDLVVYHISPQGKESKVGVANGVAVYTPGIVRKFQLRLNIIPGIAYDTGTLKAVFSSSSDVRPEKYTEAELKLQ